MAIDYLQKILTARVYDVAIESPLDLASTLSQRLRNRVDAINDVIGFVHEGWL